jgi:seryl-tRNA synthetase
MLDADFICNNVAAVKANCKNRALGITTPKLFEEAVKRYEVAVDRAVFFETKRKELEQKRGETAAKKNAISKQFPQAKTPEEKQALRDQATALDREIGVLDDELKILAGDLLVNLYQIPNMTHPAAPVGGEDANKVVAQFGEPRKFDFKPKDHVALCEALDLADFEAGTRVTGQKFYFLKNEAALLEAALVQYAMHTCVKAGYTPIITPDLARVDVLEGIGFMPRDPNPDTRQVYTVADTDLCLIATAEITLGGMHRDRIFDEAELPKRYVGLSHCFRTEAGAAGRDTRGLYRVHQFTKVEMFVFCTPENSDAIHEEIRALEEQIFKGLGLAFRVIDTATGDLGGPAYRKYDLEAWMPGRTYEVLEEDEKTKKVTKKVMYGQYGEVTSTSNCTDFQARRLCIRYRPKDRGGKNPFVHTLNGTAVACTRALVAILENGQQADGSVVIPEVLRPWVGKDVIMPKKA